MTSLVFIMAPYYKVLPNILIEIDAVICLVISFVMLLRD
jgi:hypothetical protein